MAESMQGYLERRRAEQAEQGEVLPSAQERADAELEARRDEDTIVGLARENALKALKYESQLMDKARDARDVPQALRAMSDARAKSVDTLMKLTGRDVKPVQDDFVQILQGLAAKGLLRMNVEIGQQQEPPEA